MLVTFSTFIGEISSEELLQLVSSLTEVAENDLMKMLEETEGINGLDEGFSYGLKPDLIGEYFCIRVFDQLHKSNRELLNRFFSEMGEKYFPSLVSYMYNIGKDYGERILASPWKKYFTDITLPESYTYISNNLFSRNNIIKRVKIHDRLIYINKGAFRGCSSLEEINIPNSLASF